MLQPRRADRSRWPAFLTTTLALAALAVGPMLAVGCGEGQAHGAKDAAVEATPVDVAPPPEAGPKPLALEFSATGCASFDPNPDAPRCNGTAPLTLTFTPIVSEGLTRFLWTFGDQTPASSERSPRHTYTVEGSYEVTLTAGGSSEVGSLQTTHAKYVNVARSPAGAACDVNPQCEAGLSCWCGSATPCAPVLTRGLCSRRCDDEAGGVSVCPEGTVCADLSTTGASAGGPAPAADSWRRPLCLPACGADTDCATGFQCRYLLAGQAAKVWVGACFAPYPLSIGARCGDSSGAPVDADCASHTCADLGAFRRCSADCGAIGCPPGTACAHFGDGRNLCLAACGGTTRCDDDPLLACESPGAKGPLGFAVANDPMTLAAMYCAPKRCTTAADCGPAGRCPNGGGNCQRR